jgi:hypothetical protein
LAKTTPGAMHRARRLARRRKIVTDVAIDVRDRFGLT